MRRCEIPEFCNLRQCFLNFRIAATIHPRCNQDRRSAQAFAAMHQHAASPHADRYGVEDVFQLLRRDWSRVRNWNVNVGDLGCSRSCLLAAKGDDGRDPPRIGTRQLRRIFETPEIESFPNLCHWSARPVETGTPIVLPTYLIRIQEANVFMQRSPTRKRYESQRFDGVPAILRTMERTAITEFAT